MFFPTGFYIVDSGMCIEGTIAARDESTAFPLGPEIQARLTVSVNFFQNLKRMSQLDFMNIFRNDDPPLR